MSGPAADLDADLESLLEASEGLASRADVVGNLTRIARALARRLEVDDCSVVLIDHSDRPAWVVAATDASAQPHIPLDMARHPEIREVLRTRAPVVVTDVERDGLFDGVRAHLKDQSLGSAVLFPVMSDADIIAVVRLRAQTPRPDALSTRELRLGRIFANITAMLLRNARLLQSVKARYRSKQQSAVASMQRQLRQVEKYRRFFDFAGDGQLIVDPRGRILFANRTAEAVLGLEIAALHQMRLSDLVADHGLSALRSALLALQRRDFPTSLDLPVVRADGRLRTLAITTAPVIPDDERDGVADPPEQSIILSFRDVTETRSVEADLRRTQEFLTNLIESSADAIVATDMRGRILLFNDAASRITGYSWDEAHGMLAEALYPPGFARRITAELRSVHNGGPGKVNERRSTVVAKDGELIPVNIALSVVHSPDGNEVAIVGIFSDLRSQLRLEEELTSAQAKAELSERQRAALEVAGGAAHALNQPLTAILGSVELMLRRMPGACPTESDLRRVIDEVERMAAIVDKLGRVTRYETEPYIEGKAILDLDRSSAPRQDSSGPLAPSAQRRPAKPGADA